MTKLDQTNTAQLAAMLEALASENHPNHAIAVEMRDEFLQRAHEERVEEGRRRMQQQIDDGFDVTPWTR